MSEGELDTHHTHAPTVTWNGGTLHQNGRGAPVKGCHLPPNELGHKIAHLPTSL
jgi:hypothetical protein